MSTQEEGREISEYEKLRLKRIKRNQARLAELGLDGGSKDLLPIAKKKKRNQKRASKAPSETVLRRSKRLKNDNSNLLELSHA